MADQTFRTTDQTGSGPPYGFEKTATTPKSVTDQALSAGRNLKDKAIGIAGSSSDAIKDQASEFVDAAKDVASQATDKLKQTVDGQKKAGAEYVGSLADTMRRAAREFDGDLPIAGAYIRKAASQIEGLSDSIKTGNFKDLVRGAQSFARRRPTAFLGMAVLAGFGVVRFLKSSANDSEGSAPGSRQTGGSSWAGSSVSHPRADNAESRSFADNKGYRDEFTK
jgi:gas vesicle protein